MLSVEWGAKAAKKGFKIKPNRKAAVLLNKKKFNKIGHFPSIGTSMRNFMFTLNVHTRNTFEHRGRRFNSISLDETRSATKGLRRELISFPIEVLLRGNGTVRKAVSGH